MNYPMFDPLLEAVMVMGPMKEVYYCNDACLSLLDLSRKKVVSGAPIYDFLSVDDSTLFITQNGVKGEKKETGYIEVGFVSGSGKKGLVQICILPTEELFGRNKLWFIYFHDVSLEDRLHRKYIKQLQEKEKVIQAFNHANEKSGTGLHSDELIKKVQVTHQLQECSSQLSVISDKLDFGLKKGELEINQIQQSVESIRKCVKSMQEVAHSFDLNH